MGVLLHVGMGHDAHQTCAKIQGRARIQDPGSWRILDPGLAFWSRIQWILDLVHIVFTGSCGCWILFLEKLDPGDPRFAPIKLIDSGGYSTIKGSVSPSNEFPWYFSYDRKSLFSPLDASVVRTWNNYFFALNHFCFSIPTVTATDSLANKYQK